MHVLPRNISSIFSRNFEAFASEFLELLENNVEMLLYYVIINVNIITR